MKDWIAIIVGSIAAFTLTVILFLGCVFVAALPLIGLGALVWFILWAFKSFGLI